MTFIASVVARDGVAIIADSLVTNVQPILVFDDFTRYLREQSKNGRKNTLVIDPDQLLKLFKKKPVFTKDYEDKIVKFDGYTAIALSGSVYLGQNKIFELLEEISDDLVGQSGYANQKTETRVKRLVTVLRKRVQRHLDEKGRVNRTRLIFTRFIPKTKKTDIFKITIYKAEKGDNIDEVVQYAPTYEIETVVCDGQNRTAERLLYGELLTFNEVAESLIEKICKDLKIEKESLPKDYIEKLLHDDEVKEKLYRDMKIRHLKDLSLQQAANLAALMMQVEIDFQEYTQPIPTVGGVVKLAIIDKKGFRYISGDETIKPKSI